MIRRTREEMVRDLEAQGFRFRTFRIDHDSPHAIDDWDWNQRDLPHIPFVHGGFRLVPGAVDDGLVSGIYVQRLFGFRWPITVSYHHGLDAPRSRVYSAAVGPLVVVIGAELSPIRGGTRVSTVYSLGALPLARFLLPLAERALRSNGTRLDDEDASMRARRGQLRDWGYRFAADVEGASYERSLGLASCRVLRPTGEARHEELRIGDDARELTVGRDDHLGLRLSIERAAQRLRVYPRMCPHEGASLDACPDRDGVLHCPWHGRRIAPLATFDLCAREAQVRETAHHRLTLDGARFIVAPR